jgi:hypothetical protein
MSSDSDGPANICHTFVSRDGTIKMAAASTGGIAKARRPVEIVGRPRPTTPLTNPASVKTAAM